MKKWLMNFCRTCLRTWQNRVFLNFNFKMPIIISEKYFSGCINPNTNGRLRFDFYLPDYNLCIEFDGKQHFETGKWAWTKEIKVEDIRYMDDLKNQFCKDNNINLLRLPYTLSNAEIKEQIYEYHLSVTTTGCA